MASQHNDAEEAQRLQDLAARVAQDAMVTLYTKVLEHELAKLKMQVRSSNDRASRLAQFVVSAFERAVIDGCDFDAGDVQDALISLDLVSARPAPTGSREAEDWGEGAELYYLHEWVRELAEDTNAIEAYRVWIRAALGRVAHRWVWIEKEGVFNRHRSGRQAILRDIANELGLIGRKHPVLLAYLPERR